MGRHASVPAPRVSGIKAARALLSSRAQRAALNECVGFHSGGWPRGLLIARAL